MPKIKWSRQHTIIAVQLFILFVLTVSLCLKSRQAAAESVLSSDSSTESSSVSDTENKDYIRWVDFTIPASVMEKAFLLDINSCQNAVHLDWIELLAWLGARYGGDFSHFKQADLDKLTEQLNAGEFIDEITKDMKYYGYYHEAYTAVLGGMVGYFEQETAQETIQETTQGTTQGTTQETAQPTSEAEGGSQTTATESSKTAWVSKYGLKAFSPIAKGFPYSDYDDFGTARSYGYKRQHLGHDMMGQVGTPIIAVESGYVEALGWNQYGGWRIGIRSFDKKRYYYYAHLRQNYPYQSNLQVGSTVTAGDVIGYLGRTGYSTTENTNNIDTPHLHFGLQLIFDESQKEGNNEIWIDCYELMKFLHKNQSQVVKVEGTKEWRRVYGQKEPAA